MICLSCGRRQAATLLGLRICVICAGLLPEPKEDEVTDLKTMTPRELVRGLMRGNRAELRLGYTADNAFMAASGNQRIKEPEALFDLLSYAQGFAEGMASLLQDREPVMEREGHNPGAEGVYWEGIRAGRGEPRERIYPAER